MPTPAELALLPATSAHIERARQIVLESPSLQERLNALLQSNPTRGQIVDFMQSVHAQTDRDKFERRINAICKTAGIEQPSSSDRLMAMQIGLLQEQNALLQSTAGRVLNQMRSDAEKENHEGSFSELMGAAMLRVILAR